MAAVRQLIPVEAPPSDVIRITADYFEQCVMAAWCRVMGVKGVELLGWPNGRPGETIAAQLTVEAFRREGWRDSHRDAAIEQFLAYFGGGQ